MKLPQSPVVQAVAQNLGIKTRGKFLKCLLMMNPSAVLFYYLNGKVDHIRVRPLLKNHFFTTEEYAEYSKNYYKNKDTIWKQRK